MQRLQYDECEAAFSNDFHYRTKYTSNNSTSRERIQRICQEHSDLGSSTSSLINWSSSVWIRCHDTRMDFLKFMISGPHDTPYQNGLFIFDACFPPLYPNDPPLVNLCTTGRNTVRFNPNLYNCGKVCLSLLGTWHGSESEGWIKNVSTFRQV